MAEYEQKVNVGLLEVILQELQDAQQTGILTVQRSKAGVRDVGTITLLQGEPVEAHAGERLGNDAIQWLYTWGRCQCEFLPQSPAEIVISPPPPVVEEVETSLSPLAFLSRLRIGRNPDSPEPDNGSQHERSERFNEPNREQMPFLPNTMPNTMPDVAYRPSRALPETPFPPPFQPAPPPTQPALQTAQGDASTLFSEWLQNGYQERQQALKKQAPYRVWQGQDALTFLERARASRLHRHVFLLLDGQRNTADLVRITGHSFEEITRLLNDLERLGMIKQEHELRAKW